MGVEPGPGTGAIEGNRGFAFPARDLVTASCESRRARGIRPRIFSFVHQEIPSAPAVGAGVRVRTAGGGGPTSCTADDTVGLVRPLGTEIGVGAKRVVRPFQTLPSRFTRFHQDGRLETGPRGLGVCQALFAFIIKDCFSLLRKAPR